MSIKGYVTYNVNIITKKEAGLNMNNIPRSNAETNIINTAWELWRTRIFWLMELLVSTLCNFRDLPFVIQRLLDNLQDFTEGFKKYYGYNNSKIFESLFTDNISITVKILKDIKVRDTKSVDADRIEWYKNADEIAGFLSSVNRYWDKQEWQTLLYDNLKLIEDEAIKRLPTRCTTNFATREEIDNRILILAKYTANGIIRQFII